MVKINRATQKIFGGNAPTDDIAVMGSFKAGTPVYTDDIAVLQNTAYEEGYGAALVANEAPMMEEQNSVPYILSKQLAYNFQEGIAEYDAGTTYYTGSIVKTLGENNVPQLYYSLTDDNIGNPLTDTDAWALLNLIDAERIQEQLATKAGVDLSNLTAAGWEQIKAFSTMAKTSPVSLPTSGDYVTAPSNGYYCINGVGGTAQGYVALSNKARNIVSIVDFLPNAGYGTFIPVSTGDKVIIGYNNLASATLTFIPLGGV